ncbi:MAG: insulinase family protein [Candidatus Omnitrophica bacterium]|nr:insulinase family protein [Candidatus Omnitrophota bacterium]
MTSKRPSIGAGAWLGSILAICLPLFTTPMAAFSNEDLSLPVVEYKLDNGLTVLLLERHHSPTVACQIAFRVGSNNERPGVTGSAHMLEHMMFKGTKTIGTNNYEAEVPIMEKIDELANRLLDEKLKGEDADQNLIDQWSKEIADLQEEQRKYIVSEELVSLYKKQGGTGLNAYTSDDYTNYICKLPANKLELWCWMESDRIANPVFREFYSEKEVVHEERRMRVDTDPDGSLWELFISTIFNAHPYSWMTIGWPSDIENYRRETMEEFFKRYYAPNNAVIVWVGDFNTDEAKEMIQRYFGSIPSQPTPPPVVTREPEQMGERRAKLLFDANPSIYLGWPTVAIDDKDLPALDVLEGILSSGRTSRLYRRMRDQEQLVSSVMGYHMRSEYPGAFIIGAEPLKGVPVETVEKTIREEVGKLRDEKVDDRELQRIKNKMQSEFVQKLESNYNLARDLAEHECKGGWRLLGDIDEQIQEVTAEDVQRVAQKYLIDKHLNVAILEPTGGEDAS